MMPPDVEEIVVPELILRLLLPVPVRVREPEAVEYVPAMLKPEEPAVFKPVMVRVPDLLVLSVLFPSMLIALVAADV
jgi:hypothetical protein